MPYKLCTLATWDTQWVRSSASSIPPYERLDMIEGRKWHCITSDTYPIKSGIKLWALIHSSQVYYMSSKIRCITSNWKCGLQVSYQECTNCRDYLVSNNVRGWPHLVNLKGFGRKQSQSISRHHTSTHLDRLRKPQKLSIWGAHLMTKNQTWGLSNMKTEFSTMAVQYSVSSPKLGQKNQIKQWKSC